MKRTYAAIILAAGKGSRLGQLSVARPKHTIKLQGRSLLERSCLLLRTVCDHLIIVAGRNSDKIIGELALLDQKRLTLVKDPRLTDSGCAASLAAGLRRLPENVSAIFVAEGDLALTQSAIDEVDLSAKPIRAQIAVVAESKPLDGVLFRDSTEPSFYVARESRSRGDEPLGKFVGLSLLTPSQAELLISLIPEYTAAMCSDFLGKVLDEETTVFELSRHQVGEVDTAEDYKEILYNPFLNTPIGTEGHAPDLRNCKFPLRVIRISKAHDILLAQKWGFDGVAISARDLQENEGWDSALPVLPQIPILLLFSNQQEIDEAKLPESLEPFILGGVCMEAKGWEQSGSASERLEFREVSRVIYWQRKPSGEEQEEDRREDESPIGLFLDSPDIDLSSPTLKGLKVLVYPDLITPVSNFQARLLVEIACGNPFDGPSLLDELSRQIGMAAEGSEHAS